MCPPSESPRLIRLPADLGSVTAPPSGECDPLHVGMTRHQVEAIWRATEDLYSTAMHPAISICIRRRGQTVLNRAIGHARGNAPDDPPDAARVPVTPETPFCVFSTSKAFTAIVIHLLEERGLLHMDDPIAEFIPEFGKNGKDRVSIRHVLTHRAGIPTVAGEHNDPELLLHPRRIIDLLCDAKPVSAPGRRLAYHAVTGGFILGEVVHRVTGTDLRTFFRDQFQLRAGWRNLNWGVAPERLDEVARNAFTGSPVPFPFSSVVRRALGIPFEDAPAISNDPRYLTTLVPSGNVVGSALEVAEFFEMLLRGGELRGSRFLEARTIRRALTESSYLELDLTLGFPVRYGLGLQLGSDRVSLFGPNTPRAFGHLGFINIFAWADPERETSVAILNSGKPFAGSHLFAIADLMRSISDNCPRRPASWRGGWNAR